jgi:hypothetical protein
MGFMAGGLRPALQSIGRRLSVRFPEEVDRHGGSDSYHEGSNPGLGQLLGIVRAEVSADDRAGDHDRSGFPGNGARQREGQHAHGIDNATQDSFQSIHRVNVGHAEGREHGQIHDSDAAAEIASVNGDDQFEERGNCDGLARGIMREAAFGSASQACAKYKEEGGSQHQPRQDAQECLGGRSEKQEGSGDSSDHAGDRQRDHDAPRDVEVFAIGAGAGSDAHPEGDRVGGIRLDRGNSAEHKRGEGDEASAAGDCVERAAHNSGEEEKDDGVEIQVTDVSHQHRKSSKPAATR